MPDAPPHAIPQEERPAATASCALCEQPSQALDRQLCPACRAEQRRRLFVEALVAGPFFLGAAALLYLAGRWYAG